MSMTVCKRCTRPIDTDLDPDAAEADICIGCRELEEGNLFFVAFGITRLRKSSPALGTSLVHDGFDGTILGKDKTDASHSLPQT